MTRNTLIATALCGSLILYGCGGGGPSTDVDELVSDPRYVRAQEIAEVATWLTVPASYTELTLSVQGQSQRTTLPWYGYCFRLECTMTGYGAAAGLSTTADVEDLLVPLRGAELKRLELGERAGMTTGVLAGDVDFTLGSVSADLTATVYGVWGEHGFAGSVLAEGPASGTVRQASVEDDLHIATAYVLGIPTGDNPTGVGSATWRGAAEAIALRTNERRFGTATVTMADLSRPYVAVGVIISGRSIGSPTWDDIELRSDGLFATGEAGFDGILGGFYGPGHEEVYAGFDTSTHVGAFGTRRDE